MIGLRSGMLGVIFHPRYRKVSKCEAIFRPPQTEKMTMRTLFSICGDGKISKPEAINVHP